MLIFISALWIDSCLRVARGALPPKVKIGEFFIPALLKLTQKKDSELVNSKQNAQHI